MYFRSCRELEKKIDTTLRQESEYAHFLKRQTIPLIKMKEDGGNVYTNFINQILV